MNQHPHQIVFNKHHDVFDFRQEAERLEHESMVAELALDPDTKKHLKTKGARGRKVGGEGEIFTAQDVTRKREAVVADKKKKATAQAQLSLRKANVFAKHREEIQEFKSQVGQLETKVTVIHRENKTLEKKLEGAGKKLDGAEKKMKKKDDDLAKLRTLVDKLKLANKNKSESIDALKRTARLLKVHKSVPVNTMHDKQR
jgi:predicted RNase H-like nuclease (RuvC/YqgF family)